jgi:hypothetical protein
MWTLKNIAVSAAISLGTVLFSVGSYHAGRGIKGAVAKRREAKDAQAPPEEA